MTISTDPAPSTSPASTTSSPREPQRRRARHLMDPSNPQPQYRPRGGMTLTTVQKWVASTLAVSTILHLSLGLIGAALYVPDTRTDAQIGLNILAGITGVLAVAAGLAIHGHRIRTWWLALGLIPLPIGLYFTFWF